MINLIELSESRLKAHSPPPKLGCCWQPSSVIYNQVTATLALLTIGLENRGGKSFEGEVSSSSPI